MQVAKNPATACRPSTGFGDGLAAEPRLDPQHTAKPGARYAREDPYRNALPISREAWEIRHELTAWGDVSLHETVAYITRQGLDLQTVNAFAGSIILANGIALGEGEIVLADRGYPCAVIEVLADVNGERVVVDYCGWPLDDPTAFGTIFGAGSILGGWHIDARAERPNARPLKVWRTPLEWLQAGCEGCCILDPSQTGAVLSRVRGAVVGTDRAHASELLRAMRSFSAAPRVGFIEASQ